MSERLTRILNLSKKTGDTVIVHDPSADHDMVVMSFDDYEMLITEHDTAPATGRYDEALLEELSERELIDKINRDIAVWRAYQDLTEQEKHAALLEDHLTEEPLPDPFEEDFSHRSEWHRVSDLMGEGRLSRLKEKVEAAESVDPIRTYVPVDDEVVQVPPTRDAGVVEVPHSPLSHDDVDTPSEVFQDEAELDTDDDPVFFEEPTT